MTGLAPGERQATQAGEQARRAVCPRCVRPASHCLCPWIADIDNRTPVLVLQHHAERQHALNTARLAVLGLRQARLCEHGLQPSAELAFEGYEPWLLFPADPAQPPAPETGLPRQLIVPDGTWRQVRGMVRNDPWLASLPRVSLSPEQASRYRLRYTREPGALATIEAIAAVLAQWGEPADLSALLTPFERLIEGQIAAMGDATYTANYVAGREANDGSGGGMA